MQAYLNTLKEDLRSHGFDLFHLFPLQAFNAHVDPPEKLPPLHSQADTSLLIGNSKHFWPIFREKLSQSKYLRQAQEPIDQYVVESIEYLLRNCPKKFRLRYTHDPKPSYLPIQRIAHHAGFAFLGKTNLCIHPKFGPWISLRALVVFKHRTETQPQKLSDPCPQTCKSTCQHKWQEQIQALQHSDLRDSIRRDWQNWYRIRAACTVGQEHAFCQEQIRYHYARIRPESWQ